VVPLDPDSVLLQVEAHLLSVFGQDSGRAGVSFLGSERIDVLRFGPDPEGLVRYTTLGMARHPMGDPGTDLVAAHGPRAELVLSVGGVVVAPGAGLDLGEPLWEGARFSAVLVGEPGGLVPDLELEQDEEPVRFLPLLPMTPSEAAWKRVHGAPALEQRWLEAGLDLRDPARPQALLDRPS